MTTFDGHASFNIVLLAYVLLPVTILFGVLTIGCLIEVIAHEKHRKFAERTLIFAGFVTVLTGGAAGWCYYAGTHETTVKVGSTHTWTQNITASEQELSSWVTDKYGVAYDGLAPDGSIKIEQLVDNTPVKRVCSINLTDVKKTGGGWFSYDVQGNATLVCDNTPGSPKNSVSVLKPVAR